MGDFSGAQRKSHQKAGNKLPTARPADVGNAGDQFSLHGERNKKFLPSFGTEIGEQHPKRRHNGPGICQGPAKKGTFAFNFRASISKNCAQRNHQPCEKSGLTRVDPVQTH